MQMNVLYFLKERTKFIRRFYEKGGEPFRTTIRKIDAAEAPFDMAPCDEAQDGEPPFMEEWSEASTALEMLGRTCISMLSASLQLYFETWEHEIGLVWEPEERKRTMKKGFIKGYRSAFGDVVSHLWDGCPIDFDILEQIVRARNVDQHPKQISTMRVRHSEKDWQEYPQPFFVNDSERKILSDPETPRISWMIPTLHVSTEALADAIEQVEALGGWMEPRMLAVKSQPSPHISCER
jgi:hypothetical protein